MTDRQSMIDALNAVHEFPGPYVFKVIGDPAEITIARIEGVVAGFLGEDVEGEYSLRVSKAGNHVALTARVVVPHAEMAIDIHRALVALSGVKYVL